MIYKAIPNTAPSTTGTVCFARIKILQQKSFTWSSLNEGEIRIHNFIEDYSPDKVTIRSTPWQKLIKTCFHLKIVHFPILWFSPEGLPRHLCFSLIYRILQELPRILTNQQIIYVMLHLSSCFYRSEFSENLNADDGLVLHSSLAQTGKYSV